MKKVTKAVRTTTLSNGVVVIHLSDEPAQAKALLTDALNTQTPPTFSRLREALVKGGLLKKGDQTTNIFIRHTKDGLPDAKMGDVALVPEGTQDFDMEDPFRDPVGLGGDGIDGLLAMLAQNADADAEAAA